MAAPTSQETTLISQFRQRLCDLKLDENQNSDYFLLQWIRAREHNLDQAEKMLRKSLKWREEKGINSIQSWQAPEYVVKQCGILSCGFDEDNSPVIIIPGKLNIRKMIKLGYREDYERYVVQCFERVLMDMKGRVTREGLPVTQFVSIVDCAGVSIKQYAGKGALDTILSIVNTFEANYPESLKATYLINVGKVTTSIYAIIKPILSKKTEQVKWKKALLKNIPADQLPVPYGGTSAKTLRTASDMDDPDDQAEDNENERVTLTLVAGECMPVEFQVDVQEANVTWTVEVEEGEIGFLVTLNDDLKQKDKVKAGKPIEGSLVCHSKGVCRLLFDNSATKSKSRVIKYTANIFGNEID